MVIKPHQTPQHPKTRVFLLTATIDNHMTLAPGQTEGLQEHEVDVYFEECGPRRCIVFYFGFELGSYLAFHFDEDGETVVDDSYIRGMYSYLGYEWFQTEFISVVRAAQGRAEDECLVGSDKIFIGGLVGQFMCAFNFQMKQTALPTANPQ